MSLRRFLYSPLDDHRIMLLNIRLGVIDDPMSTVDTRRLIWVITGINTLPAKSLCLARDWG